MRGRGAAALIAACLLGLTACAHRGATRLPERGERGIGLYKARAQDASGRTRRFRLLLFAARPDRLHAEIVSPVGTTELIVDAGGGRISIARMRERVAYAGLASPDVLDRLLGLRIGVPELVRGLLDGASPDTNVRVTRTPPKGGALPERLSIRSSSGSLELELRRLRRPPEEPAALGRGEPPAGFAIRELSELTGDALPEWESEGAEGP